jgi:uncharacterized membrane protein
MLLVGSIINYQIKSIYDGVLTLILVCLIFFGFPVKEYSDFFKLDSNKKIFMNLGEDYILDEYITTHYVVNILVENIPAALFVLVNNYMLDRNFHKYIIIDPIVVNSAFILINGLIIFSFYHHTTTDSGDEV